MGGRLLVRNVAIHPDGVAIDYLRLPADTRENGLTVTHNIWIPRGEDYEDELDAIEDAVKEAVMDALEDLGNLPEPDLRSEVQRAVDEAEDDEDEQDTQPIESSHGESEGATP